MRYESAELAKISINCCLVASVSVANTLAELCEQIGADWSEIAPALEARPAHRRRTPTWRPASGIAGGNLERDLATVERLAASHGTEAGRGRGLAAQQPAPPGLGRCGSSTSACLSTDAERR